MATISDSEPRPSLWSLFLGMARVGCTAFGGPAMIPYIRAWAVERKAWLDDEDFARGMAATQMIPGATAMQAAAWAGVSCRGAAGALAAYLGFGLPAFLLMLGLSALYFASRDLPAIMAVFQGLQVVVAALVCHAAVNFSLRYLTSWLRACLALGAGLWLGLGGSPILALVMVCLAGLALFRDIGPLPPDAASRTRADNRLPGALRACLFTVLFTVLWMGLVLALDPPLFRLCLAMLKIDCFAFGGGYVTLPLMLHEVTANLSLMSEPMFMDGIALGQVTPGPIVMTSAFVGYALRGVVGAACATVAVFTPSFVGLVLAHAVTGRLVRSLVARRVLAGSLVSLVGLLAAMGARFVAGVDWGLAEAAIGVGAFVALRLGVDVLWVVLVGAGVSVALL